MNQDFDLDQETAQLLSPALQKPVIQVPCTCWVGYDERPEFIRQNQLLADAWKAYGVSVRVVLEPNKHHFDVINGLACNTHPLFATVLGRINTLVRQWSLLTGVPAADRTEKNSSTEPLKYENGRPIQIIPYGYRSQPILRFLGHAKWGVPQGIV